MPNLLKSFSVFTPEISIQEKARCHHVTIYVAYDLRDRLSKTNFKLPGQNQQEK